MVADRLHQRSTTQRPHLLGDRAASLTMQRSQQITRRETDHRFPFLVSALFRRRTLRGDTMGMTAQPSAPAAPKSLLSDVLDVFNVLHEPTAVFTRVKERPRILAPWIVFSLAFIVISILTQPYQQAAMEAFKATLTPEQAARMGNRGAGGGVVGLVLTPAFVLLFFAIGAGLLWMGVSITGAQARFKTLLSVLAYS